MTGSERSKAQENKPQDQEEKTQIALSEGMGVRNPMGEVGTIVRVGRIIDGIEYIDIQFPSRVVSFPKDRFSSRFTIL